MISSIRYDNGQKAYFYSKDIQGSTSVITDEDGNCVASYDYTDYGETTKKVNAEFYNEICYTGGVYDELTGQYYLNARYYNPKSGVFLSQDTYRGSDTDYKTWNLYAYCAGNPIKYVDPSGHWIDFVVDAIGFAASAYSFICDPSVENAIYMAVDIAFMIVPVATGAGVAKAVLKHNDKVVASAKLASKKTNKLIRKKVKQAGKKVISKYGGKKAAKKAGKQSLKRKIGDRLKKITNTFRRTLKCSRINPYSLTPTHSQTLGKNKMQKFVKKIEKEGIQETIKYVKYGGKKYVVDGHHRLLAAKKLRLQQVPVEEVKLPYAGYKTVRDLLCGD